MALYSSSGGKITLIEKVWMQRHGNNRHPHAAVEVMYDDGGKHRFDDFCSFVDFRADGGSVEIDKTMRIHMAEGVSPLGVGL